MSKQIRQVIELCMNNYKEKTFLHCQRVANYAMQNVCLASEEERETAYIIAMCHDLLEDTDVNVDKISEASGYPRMFLENVLGALTKKPEETYVDYIKRLKANKSIYPYIIKLADMKDHLTQKETLSDRLKEKYWNALPYLL